MVQVRSRRFVLGILCAVLLPLGIASCGPKDKVSEPSVDSHGMGGGGVCTPISLTPIDDGNEAGDPAPPPGPELFVDQIIPDHYDFCLKVGCEDTEKNCTLPADSAELQRANGTPLTAQEVTISGPLSDVTKEVKVGETVVVIAPANKAPDLITVGAICGTITRKLKSPPDSAKPYVYDGPIRLVITRTANGKVRKAIYVFKARKKPLLQ